MKAQATIPVRITARRYKDLRRSAKLNGHSISWLLNYCIDLYFQDLAKDMQAASPQQGIVGSDQKDGGRK